MTRTRRSPIRRSLFQVESLEGRKLMAADVFNNLMPAAAPAGDTFRFVNRDAAIDRIIAALPGDTLQQKEKEYKNLMGGGKAGDSLEGDLGLTGVKKDKTDSPPANSIVDLKLNPKGPAGHAGTGSFEVAAGSELANLMDLAIEEHVGGFDVEIREVDAKGVVTVEDMKITFDSIDVAKAGGKDVVEFTFTQRAVGAGK